MTKLLYSTIKIENVTDEQALFSAIAVTGSTIAPQIVTELHCASVGLSSSRIHHHDAAATHLFFPVFNYYVSIVLSQSKARISHPPPLINTSSDRVIADVIPGLDWSRSRFHPV
ncbi:hypothetical protein CEXT_100571 [Caerostris extrusa]|uniref:Uncharacterized protein n=1 Tax=Caerostris extrusa TaxID=172846 RepID=A0AAV4UFW9_CAEEX|nr:hypothetical protein CEXT_100571 [Caerostris extrusa]